MFIPPFAGNVRRVSDLLNKIQRTTFDLVFLAGNNITNNVIVPQADDPFFDRVYEMHGLGAMCGNSTFVRDVLIPHVTKGIALQEAFFSQH